MAYKKLSQHSLLKDDNQHPWQIMKTGYYSKHHHGWGKEIYVDNKALFRVEFINLSLKTVAEKIHPFTSLWYEIGVL